MSKESLNDGHNNGKVRRFIPRADNMLSLEAQDLYRNQAAGHELLTAEDEIKIGKRMEAGKIAGTKLNDPNLNEEEKQKLIKTVQDGLRAQDELITSNVRLVISVAKKYIGKGVPLADLIEEGNVGLTRATKKFDYRKGNRFSTYATWWIRQAITRDLANSSRTVRIPVHMHQEMGVLKKTQRRLEQELGRTPTELELAQALDMNSGKVKVILKTMQSNVSLSKPIKEVMGETEETTFEDLLTEDEAKSPENVYARNQLREEIDHLLLKLPPREAMVVSLKYNLNGDGQNYTEKDIAKKMRISRGTFRKLLRQAIYRLSQMAEVNSLRMFLED